MMVDVHMTHPAIVLRFASRAAMIALIQRDPASIDEHGSVNVWIDRGQGEGFVPARTQFLRKGSIALIEQVPVEERNAFLAEHAPTVLAGIQAREDARTARETRVA